MDWRLQENLNGKQHDYMAPFLWLHGEDDALIVNEIQRIYDSGIRSVCLESRVHEDFGKEGWWSDVRLIMEECRKKDMRVWILDDKHFPSGFANDALRKEEYKHLRPWGITERHIDVSGPIEDGAAMTDFLVTEEGEEILAVLACKHVPCSETYTEILDISEYMQDKMVYFSLPEGMWRIVFLIKTQSGLSEGSKYYCDMLSADSVKVFVDSVYESHYTELKEYFGNTFLGFFSDEPSFRNNSQHAFTTEIGKVFAHYPWHDKLIKLLEEVLGADAKKMLAGLWFDIEGVTEQIRYAYMDIISKEYSKNFCKQLGEWCHAHGVEYIGHVIEDNNAHAKTGSGTAHYFRALKDQDMSGIDIVLHQLIPGLTECASAGQVCYEHMENNFFHYYLGKLASSLAHIDEKKKGRAMCEIFGAFGWAEGTRYMKYLADHMLVRGINYYVPHAFSPKENDPDCPPNFFDTGENAHYKYFRVLMDYMNRICHLHNGGVHVPTAAILYDAEAHWVNKKRVPLELCAKALYDNLLDYDILPADALGQVDEEGCLNGEKYPCLLVPCYEGMSACVVESIKKCSLPVIFVTMSGMEFVEDYLSENGLNEKGAIVDLTDIANYVRQQFGADVGADYEGNFLRYYHYVRDGVHSYMFSSEDIHNTIRTKVSLSAFSGGNYLVYDAMENKAFAGFSENGEIEIELLPYNSVILMCGDILVDGLPKVGTTVLEEQVISPEFKISYAKEIEKEFKYYKTTNQLFNFTGRNGMPYFSGNMKYEGSFELAVSGNYLLDLGQVGEAVQVWVNGIFVGSRLIPPYAFDISNAVQVGKNELMIVVSNHSGYERRDWFSRFVLFEPSGLLGPIRLKRISDI